MSDRLSEFGYTFQIKIITCLLKDKQFLQQIDDILEPDYFENESNQFLVKVIKDYFRKYKTQPTAEVLKVKISEITDDVFKKSIVANVKDTFKYVDSQDLDFVMEQTLDFCKNKVLKQAIIDSVELLNSGNYDAIKAKVDAAMTAGTERNVGHDYVEMVDDRYNQATRHILPTGWDVIDNLMDGGLGKGELGVVVAPAGIGKSFLLVNLGANVIKQGKNVLHYTLELNEAYVGLRYDSVITGIANQELKYNIDAVKETVEKIPGNLIVKYYPTKTAAISTIASHVERYRMLGKEPDMVILDYADLLRGNGGQKDYRLELGNIYEELRGLAGTLDVPVWTASQANRSALQEDVIQADKIAESYSKIMTADFVMSLSRKIEDKVGGTGRIHVIKNRFGPDGITFPSQIDTNNGSFNIFDESSVTGKELTTQMSNHQEYLRKEMKKRFEELDN
jgi:replicative DNA helicase